MLLRAKRAWSLMLAMVLAFVMCVPATALALDGNGDTSEDSNGSVAVYVRDGEGNEILLKDYSAEDLVAMAQEVDAGYQYGDAGLGAAHSIVSFDDLIADAGGSEYWTEGASLEFTCTDGVYGKFIPTYEQLHTPCYYYPSRSATDTGNVDGAMEVPTGFAPSGQYAGNRNTTGFASDELTALLEKIAAGEGDPGTKLVMGLSDAEGMPGNAGWRMVSNFTKITILAPEGVSFADQVVLKVNLSGDMVKCYTAEQMAALLHDDTQYYVQSNHGSVRGIAVTDYVTFDELLADAGLSDWWTSDNSCLQYVCYDGVYGKDTPTYEEIHSQIYTYPNQSATDMTNTTGAIEVPAVLAYTSAKVDAADGLVGDTFSAAEEAMETSDTLSVFRGWAPDENGAIEAPGWRLAGGVLEVNLVPAASLLYSDIEAGAWYEEALTHIIDMGLIRGYDDGTFGPENGMTRAQLATILWRYAEPEAEANYNSDAANATGMADVEDNAWYTGAANWAVESGVINGAENADGTRSFNPDKVVSFEEMVTIIANFAAEEGAVDAADLTVLNDFSDAASVDSWEQPSMAWALANGVVNGYDNGTLLPQEDVYRARGAAVLYNAIGGVM